MRFRNPQSDAARRTKAALLAGLGLSVACASACQPDRSAVQSDDADLTAHLRLLLPRAVEVQRYLTQPVSFAGDGNADGIEAIVAAMDEFALPVKAVGTFQLEVHRTRIASADRLGQRLAQWKIDILSEKALAKYWDRYSRWFVFPLRLDTGVLEPGRYILTVRLHTPTGETLFDEYEFEHPGGAVPTVSPTR